MPDFERSPLYEMTRELAATARRDLPATLVVRGGTLVSVNSGEILPGVSVAVRGSRIAYVGHDVEATVKAHMEMGLDPRHILVVLPELHVSDKGPVGVGESGFGFVDLIEKP